MKLAAHQYTIELRTLSDEESHVLRKGVEGNDLRGHHV